MTIQLGGVSKKAMIAAIAASMLLVGCSDRTVGLGAIGAAGGAIIGGATGGWRGAAAGAVIGGAAGTLFGMVLDHIEQQQLAEQRRLAARTGGGTSRSFSNSSGKRVQMQTRTTRTYDCGGTRCRDISTSITRDGQTETKTAVAREVKTGGATEWAIE